MLADIYEHGKGQTVLSRVIKATPDTGYEAVRGLGLIRSFDQIRLYRVTVVVIGDGRDDRINVAIFEKSYERLLVRVVDYYHRDADFFFKLWVGLNVSEDILHM